MCTRKQANIDQNLNDNTLVRPSSFRRTVAWLTLVAYIGQPMIVTAQVIADQAAAANKRPVVDTTANGLPLVQIATPSAAGVSHNQYTQFNVDPAGLILNNSQAAVLTQQAGYVAANPNLVNGSARVILNEVTSTNRSQLNGYTEVAGQRAEVIIANPNGITCNGCGFINTSRGVLTTGTPVMGINGSLDAFRVTGGDIQIGTAGLNGSNLSQLDLISRSVKVNGQIWGNNLNVITGANLANYNTLGVQVIQGTGTKPTVGIDVALLGGMYANKIRLIGTEAGVGVNSLGTIAAQAGDFNLDSQGQITLAGSASASGNITINGAAGTTNSGILYSRQNVQITDQGTIINSGILSAQGNLNLNAANINSTGALGAGIGANGSVTQSSVLTLNAANRINATGQNIAGGNLSLTGATVNLANSRTTAGGGAVLTATAGDIINSGSVSQSLGALTLNATGVINNDRGILAGNSLTASAASLSNGQGMLIGSGGNLALKIAGPLNNTGGTIASALDTALTANTITGNGKIIAGRDASLSLQGNYTYAAGNLIKANRNLAFTTTGTFTNQAILDAIGNLTLNAGNIDNQASAIINSANTTLNSGTGSIGNAGSIEGNTIATASNIFTNTGAVIGNNITLRANSLSNLHAAAIIAATQSVNLIVQNAIVNQDGATIYSLGDVNIGANLALSAASYLAGNAASVTNSSATIEAGGNLNIGANTITNTRTVVGVQWTPEVLGTPTTAVPIPAPLPPPKPVYNAKLRKWVIPKRPPQVIPGTTPGTWNAYYTPSTATEQFTPNTTPSAQLLAGKNMRLGGITVTNNYSTITAAQILTSNAAVTNSGAPFRIRTSINGTQTNWVTVVVGSTCNGFDFFGNCIGGTSPVYGLVNSPIPYTPAPTYTPIAGSVNVAYAQNTPITAPAPTSPAKAVIGNTTVPVAPAAANTALTVPTNGLYTIHNQAGQRYLVVTDPRFTSYQNFISSDYMMSRLALDPSLIQKRLGDGFYEQQLVADQLAQLTGRRNLAGYGSTQASYQALMDAALAAASDLELVPGIALTAAQIAALKRDIVWMVEEEVRLPDGSMTSALAPVVYLSNATAMTLRPSGALIAANEIDIKSSSVFDNSGTVISDAGTSLNVGDLINRGTIRSGGTLELQAANDILNFSGTIAGRNVNLMAGRDIRNERTANDITRSISLWPGSNGLFGMSGMTGSATSTELGLEAGITATDKLNISAGRNLSIVAATVKAGGDASLNAGENITVGALTTRENSSGAYSSYHNSVTNLGSRVDVGGSLDIKAGNDLQLTAAKVNAGSNLTLAAGGNIDVKAAKDSVASGYNSGIAQEKRLDETVIGTSLNAGNILTLIASNGQRGRADGKGNIALNSVDIASKSGNVAIMADANVNIGVTEEQHNTYFESHTEESGLLTHTKRDERRETWRTDTIGSSVTGDNVRIISGKDINLTGTRVAAVRNIDVAAMGNLNITAATNTYGSDHYSHETTTGLQFSNAFSITDHGPDITSKAHTDGTKQSFNRSSLSSKEGNLSILSGGNLIASGTDLAANAGNLALTAGGTVALLAGQDTLNQSSSTVTVTDPNFFTKQRHTITDTNASLDYQGSTAQGKSVKVSSGADIVLQAADVKAGEGGINLDAGGDIKLLAAANQHSRTHTEKLQTDGYLIQADGTIDGNADRRINNKYENQTVTNQVTKLASLGDIKSHSGRNTLIEATAFDAQGGIDLSAGTEATYNEDGSIKTEARKGDITFAAIKDSTYTNNEKKQNSDVWQSSSGHGEMVETVKLANIKSGKGLNVNATGDIIVDIPEVPKEAPAPVEKVEPIPTKGPDGKPLTKEQKAAIVAERAAKAAEKAARDAEAKKIRDVQRFNDHIQALAGKPGQEWIGQLVKLSKEKPDSVKLQQVNAALEHWDYSHGGLTPEATAVIAIVITYFTAGAGSGIVGATATGATATTTGIVTAAVVQAAVTTLAIQATTSLINNKGNVAKTLDDMGKSENVKALVTAMVTAGVLAGLSQTLTLGDSKTSLNSINAKSDFTLQLEKNLINNATGAVINHAMYGGDLQQQLEQSLKSSFIDTGAAMSANWIGDMKVKGDLNAFTHKLAHAIAGCAIGAAKAGDCGSGALGAVVGEMSAEWYGGSRTSATGINQPGFQTDTVNFARMMAGIAVAITGGDANAINLAASTGGNAAENNWLNHNRPSMLALSEKEKYDQANKDCGNGNDAQCGVATKLRDLSNERDRQLNMACADAPSSGCSAAARDAILAGNNVFTGPDGHTYAISGTVTVLSAPDDPRNGTFQAQQAANLKEGIVIASAGAAVAAGGGILYDMGAAAQTKLLTDGVAGISAGQWVTTAGIGAGLSGTTNLALDPNASPASLTVSAVSGAIGGVTKLGLNAAAGLANQWVPTTLNNLITYSSSWSVSHIISDPNSAINQSINPNAGTSVWTSPVFTCGPYPRNPC